MALIAETIAKPCTHWLHTDSYSPVHDLLAHLLILGKKGVHRESTLYLGVRYGEVRYSEGEV